MVRGCLTPFPHCPHCKGDHSRTQRPLLPLPKLQLHRSPLGQIAIGSEVGAATNQEREELNNRLGIVAWRAIFLRFALCSLFVLLGWVCC